MKVLIALDHSGFFRHFDTVAAHLCEQGHRVAVTTRLGPRGGEEYLRDLLEPLVQGPNGSYDLDLLKRSDSLRDRLRTTREVMDYAIYFRRQHNSPLLAERREERCPPVARRLVSTRTGRSLVSRDGLLRLYRRWQARVPADPAIVDRVAAAAPDVLVACPFISPLCWDFEYLRAAQKLGIPTVAAVASWDNLSTKGTFHLMPDSILVWNRSLADEAAAIHAVPRDRLALTGGPKFDPYFGLEPSLSRERFCAQVGIDPERPYLLHLGSSEKVAGDETAFARDLADALRANPRTAGVQVMVRPHPVNGPIWRGFHHDGVVVYPPVGARPDVDGAREDYFHSLRYAVAALGVNTSAFLEAAIADLPCLSVVSDRHREGQVDRGHFQHLLAGRFIETVQDLETAAEAVAELMEGEDPRRERRRTFVADFVRPPGIERPAGEATAEAILAAAAAGPRGPEPVVGGRRRRREQAGASAPGALEPAVEPQAPPVLVEARTAAARRR
ncbi:MAG: hypothetical protein ACJ76S_12400 [Solirubrobacteraceae bacterium]